MKRASWRCPAKTWQARANAPSATPASRPRPRPIRWPRRRAGRSTRALTMLVWIRCAQTNPPRPNTAAPVKAPIGPTCRRSQPIRPQSRQPDGEHRVEVERLPGLEPGVKQVFQRVQISRLALAEKRHPVIEARQPPREPAQADLPGEEVAVRVVDLGHVEVEQGLAEGDGVPEEEGDGRRPDQDRDEVGRAHRPALEPPDLDLPRPTAFDTDRPPGSRRLQDRQAPPLEGDPISRPDRRVTIRPPQRRPPDDHPLRPSPGPPLGEPIRVDRERPPRTRPPVRNESR